MLPPTIPPPPPPLESFDGVMVSGALNFDTFEEKFSCAFFAFGGLLLTSFPTTAWLDPAAIGGRNAAFPLLAAPPLRLTPDIAELEAWMRSLDAATIM
jgi:hypothetical protein